MDGNNPKVSFIPKGSLVREESFLERSRPRSVIGIVAIFAFVLSAGIYGAFFYYNNILNETIAQKTSAIEKANKEFSDAPEVGEAKVFRVRTDLARELLNNHSTVSPILSFLSKNTTESIMYTSFNFKKEINGPTLDLAGEAPTYAALAYQADVLREKMGALSGASITNMTLTEFGTIAFTLKLVFSPAYVSYVENLRKANASEVHTKGEGASVVPPLETKNEIISESSTGTPLDIAPGNLPVAEEVLPLIPPQSNDVTTAVPTNQTVIGESGVGEGAPKQSVLMSLWQKFKFW
ncbi:MAG: hypothetical protein Q7K40_00535 [bacterium]|nr:hypothetical protein [bacterium]